MKKFEWSPFIWRVIAWTNVMSAGLLAFGGEWLDAFGSLMTAVLCFYIVYLIERNYSLQDDTVKWISNWAASMISNNAPSEQALAKAAQGHYLSVTGNTCSCGHTPYTPAHVAIESQRDAQTKAKT